ncbi:GNAT family N-acetyltransferase [Peribacillus huizhouensis]|uniref:Ribosomal protein S18 acetylase RimI-like enzyme n=1 Tax=Peribacillus huizhouensis TaxID=1501239 RepID=A0ABR6CJW7_9BACI|nr:GNAT family N-acetyltransferase [Peribacillus huizhouensis]MBA9025315.1 ribosomal protein S18 acetylase RimI-like enzyme [Peribacillus huizhouensis]
MIRPIEVRDAKSFIELSKKIDDSNFMLFEPGERNTTLEQQCKFIERILSEKKSIIFVAESEHNLVGFIAAFGGNLKRNQHSAYLVLGVLEEFQGQGFASKLFNQIFEWARNNEISRLGLTVIKDNIKAFNLYRKMGFVLEGEKVHSLIINGEPVNEYYFYKLL